MQVDSNNCAQHHTTLVTAFYDIGCDTLNGKHAKRSFDKYLKWFKYVLSINAPMVIYVSKQLHAYVLEHRPQHYTTLIIIREFVELAAYRYYDRMQHTINTMIQQPNINGQIPRYFKECPEFITAKYETIVFSKFDFLREVANNNTFVSQYFIWLDAGTFYDQAPFDVQLPWPDSYKVLLLEDKFLVANYSFDINNKQPLQDKKNYLYSNRNEICAYILGGTKLAINRVHKQFWNLVDDALNMGVINNEQHFLQLMVLEKSDWYYPWYRTRNHYNALATPLCDRMIPSELATGTYIGENYSIHRNIKVLTIATKNLSKSAYQRWESTAIHYGYNYEVLGRTTEWKGFNTKIRLYYEKLLQVSEPYSVLTDCTDVFFCASAHELYNKINTMQESIIVGGEFELYYPEKKGGKYNREELTAMFNKFNTDNSKFVYPNSGFLAGNTETLRKLMSYQINYHDDQVACIDAMYQSLVSIKIDYNTTIIGNVPNYQNRPEVKCFVYDKILGRYGNRESHQYPIAFHFPGKNWNVMQEFYNITQNDLYTTNLIVAGSSTNIGMIFIVIIIVLILITILVVLLLWSKR